MRLVVNKTVQHISLVAISLLLAACGGGGGGGGGAVSTPSISITGVAATGAAISGGTVEAKCSTGTGTATTNADGTYSVSVTNGVQPCILKATDPISKIELHSIVESGSSTANITPVTDLVVANTLGDDPSTGFTNFSAAAQAKVTASNISAAVTKVQAVTASLGADADMSGVDFMKGSMVAATPDGSGDSTDKKIDALMAALAAADKKISDLSAQVKSLTSVNNATSVTTTLVGNAQYSLSNCAHARSGDIWVLDLIGSPIEGWNINYNTMVLKKLSDNSTYAINLKRDSGSNIIPCAFTASINGSTVEYRVSTSGVGVWKNSSDFGLTVPAQKTKAITDTSFVGTYPAVAYVKLSNSSTRVGLPFRFEISADGSVTGYTCDLTKPLPDCSSETADSKDPVTCTSISNGTISCTSLGGLAATGVLYVTGGQASMFLAVTNLSSSYRAGGLIAMTKAMDMKLPTVGKTSEAGSRWYVGVASGSNNITSFENAASKVESVDVATNSYVTSSTGTTVTTTNYINTPAKGFEYGVSSGTKGLGMGTNGWALLMTKSPSATNYDGWYAAVRTK
jgi:hypothetical protein